MSVNIGPVFMSDRVALIGAGVAVLLVFGALWYVKRQAGKAIEAVSPLNPNNAIKTTVDRALAPALGTNSLTGKPNTLGSAIYHLTH